MRRTFSLVVLIALAAAGAPRCFAQAAAEIAAKVKVTLTDDSQLIGSPLAPSFALAAAFGKAEIPLEQIASIDFTEDSARVTFCNRDTLSGKPEGGAFALRTVFKDVRLGYAQIRQIQVTWRQGAAAGADERGLLLHARMDAADEDLGRFGAHMDARNVQAVEGPAGEGALLLGSADARVTIRLPFSPYKMPEGTISFWAKLPHAHKPFGGGKGQPWFFGIECPLHYFGDNLNPDANYNNHSIFGFTSNDGGGNSGLVGRLYGLASAGTHHFGAVSTVAETGLLGDTPNGWHHYSFVWKRDGIELADGNRIIFLLAVDWKAVAFSSEMGTDPYGLLDNPNSAVNLVIHDSDSDCTRSVAMCELKIWDYARLPAIEH